MHKRSAEHLTTQQQEDLRRLGELIRQSYEKSGLAQQGFAQAVHAGRTSVSSWVNGRSVPPLRAIEVFEEEEPFRTHVRPEQVLEMKALWWRLHDEKEGRGRKRPSSEARPGALQRPAVQIASLVVVILTVVVVGTMVVRRATERRGSNADYVRGSVTCASGAHVVGVWIEAEEGGSGWASWERTGAPGNNAQFGYTLPSGGRYQVHVGCGGTPQRWDSNNKSSFVRGNRRFICHEPPTGSAERGSCTALSF